MKINYKNTALGLIDDPKNFEFGFPDPEITPFCTPPELRKFGYSLVDSGPKLKELCGHNIQYCSNTFMEAFAKAKPKLADVFEKEEIEEGGVVITGGFTGGYTHWHTYYYYVKTAIDDKGEWDYSALFIDFSKHSKANEHALDIYVSREAGDTATTLIWNKYIEDGRDEFYWQAYIIAFVLFKKYCDLETKIITKKSVSKHLGTKYVNETDKRITVLDSTWFTTIVRSEGFMVGDETGGFFRLQPCGPNNSQRKLIWITPFEKKGYTRKAKILHNEYKGNEPPTR